MPVILRVGPYICGEWDYGGLPAWVMNIPGELQKPNIWKWYNENISFDYKIWVLFVNFLAHERTG